MVVLVDGIEHGHPTTQCFKKLWIRSESNGFLHALEEWLINLDLS